MRTRWYNGAILITPNTVAERETLIKVYDFFERLEFGRELKSGVVSDSDDVELVTLNE